MNWVISYWDADRGKYDPSLRDGGVLRKYTQSDGQLLLYFHTLETVTDETFIISFDGKFFDKSFRKNQTLMPWYVL